MNRIDVRRKPGGLIHEGLFSFGETTISCCLGRSGITTRKREGDGATPVGIFTMLYGFYRKDRVGITLSGLPLSEIRPTAGWCDEPSSANYNQHVVLPFDKSHEKMLRDDRLYDICIVLDYNIHPRKRNAGSAIFFHQMSEKASPTEGCIAISPENMRLLLPAFSTRTRIFVHP